MKTTLTQVSCIRNARAFITVFLTVTSITISAQVPFWSNNGNNATSNDFLGTTNNQPLIFKTNGLEAMRLSLTSPAPFTVEVFNDFGQKVFSKLYYDREELINIDLSEMSSGIYLFKVTQNEVVLSDKLIKK